MINVHKSIHDNFTVEFKIGYSVEDYKNINQFSVKTWIFMPNTLSITNQTYNTELFYRDLKVNTRLITPIFTMEEIACNQSIPLHNLKESINNLIKSRSNFNILSYEYHIKMFLAITRSAVRTDLIKIKFNNNDDELSKLIEKYEENINNIITEYRKLKNHFQIANISKKVYDTYRFGDEYLSNMIDVSTIKTLLITRNKEIPTINEKLINIISDEKDYRVKEKYITVDKNSKTNNREYIFRMSALKRFVDSDLFIAENKKKDAVITQQIYYSLAAGISMVFATAIAFSFQQKFGNYTMPLFVALVISYMLNIG